jgi:hypothetical protein
MSTSYPTQQQRAAYEQYVRANWHTLSPNEQEQARAYFQAASAMGYANAPATSAPGWTIALGYVCCVLALAIVPILFAPAGFGLGLYNKSKGSADHGKIQMVLAVVCGAIGMVLGAIVWASR